MQRSPQSDQSGGWELWEWPQRFWGEIYKPFLPSTPQSLFFLPSTGRLIFVFGDGAENMLAFRSLRRSSRLSRAFSANIDAARAVVEMLATRDPAALALVAPAQNLRWTYGELAARVESVAYELRADGVTTLGVALGSVGENVVAQLGAVLAGVDVTTVKLSDDADANSAAFQGAVDALGCSKLFVAVDGDVKYGDVTGIVGVEPTDGGCGSGSSDGTTYFYNSTTKGVTLAELLAHGRGVAAELALCGDDRVCVPVTLNHPMGFGFGVLGAFSAGAAVILPSPGPDALFTLAALRSECATVLLSDTHTANKLDAMALPEPVEGLDALRAGLVKVGSGECFGLGSARPCLGIDLTTVGTPPKK